MVLISLVSFILVNTAHAVQLEFEAAASVRALDEESDRVVKAGESFALKSGGAYVVQIENIPPLLVMNPASSQSEIKVKSAQVESLFKSSIQPMVERAVNETLSDINQVQFLMQKRDYAAAGAQIKLLKDKYPNIATIHFLSASIQFLSNNKKLALDDVRRGLQIDPSNESAKRLLQQLEGK